MAVEPSMSEARRIHHFSDGDRLETLRTKQSAGRIQNPEAVLCHLFSSDSHSKISTTPLTFT
ncbi:hypothetical protein KL86PLE_40442 [uncultured Pleomorphomonas sp.]|uniref:Uncharacterized protein n=1 Tax=uncultured Pleomorphomonas sp. TaxID=442121 RepID=A0A212LGP2_9HYPH|nr:hypothetical protein KL86PLE_40442 [uncultured Pleomorphomonas sp.]